MGPCPGRGAESRGQRARDTPRPLLERGDLETSNSSVLLTAHRSSEVVTCPRSHSDGVKMIPRASTCQSQAFALHSTH